MNDERIAVDTLIDDPVDGPETTSRTIERELEEVRTQLLRVAADFENYRKRVEREREEVTRLSNERLFQEILPAMDNLERALSHVGEGCSEEVKSFSDGVSMVLSQLEGVLRKFEVEGFGEIGERFDPAFHEAMAQATRADLPPNAIAHVVQRGYSIRGHLLRPALVLVTSPDSGTALPAPSPEPPPTATDEAAAIPREAPDQPPASDDVPDDEPLAAASEEAAIDVSKEAEIDVSKEAEIDVNEEEELDLGEGEEVDVSLDFDEVSASGVTETPREDEPPPPEGDTSAPADDQALQGGADTGAPSGDEDPDYPVGDVAEESGEITIHIEEEPDEDTEADVTEEGEGSTMPEVAPAL